MSICVGGSASNNISKFNKCANCGACYNACPTGAITVKEGIFYSVEIDEDKCVNCGKCVKVCPVNTYSKEQNIVAGYSAEHYSDDVILQSSSGGAFSALAHYILEQGGVVWGAGYNDGCDKVVFLSTNDTSLDNLRRSKYVESSVGDSFKKIKEILDKGQKVLFCGTPCQVAGLKRFVGDKDYLYTLDFACGGLASHKLYKEWLDSLKSKYKSTISKVNFRSKHFGWGIYCITVDFQNGKKYVKPAVIDPYFASFINGKKSVREYCYECQFSDNHYADLILADYWKYKETYKTTNNDGISLILVNSEKGAVLMEKIKTVMNVQQLPLDKATYNIKKTVMSTERYNKREAFLDMAKKDGLYRAAEKYSLPKTFDKMLYCVRVYLKKTLQRRKK